MLSTPSIAAPVHRGTAGRTQAGGAEQSIIFMLMSPSEGAEQSIIGFGIPSEGAEQSIIGFGIPSEGASL